MFKTYLLSLCFLATPITHCMDPISNELEAKLNSRIKDFMRELSITPGNEWRQKLTILKAEFKSKIKDEKSTQEEKNDGTFKNEIDKQ